MRNKIRVERRVLADLSSSKYRNLSFVLPLVLLVLCSFVFGIFGFNVGVDKGKAIATPIVNTSDNLKLRQQNYVEVVYHSVV